MAENSRKAPEKAAAPSGSWRVRRVLFLLVFVITDMLCATNIYSFVNCVR